MSSSLSGILSSYELFSPSYSALERVHMDISSPRNALPDRNGGAKFGGLPL